MPAGDGTGPLGRGPRTGRGLGWCSAPIAEGARPYFGGFGLGWGWRGRGICRGWGPRGGVPGFGFGPRWGWRALGPMSREEELQWLRGYTANLGQALEQARKRMAELEGEAQT